MTFEEILDHAMAVLQRRGRLTYGTLERQCQLDDAALEDSNKAFIEGQRLAADELGNVQVWTGAEVSAPHLTPSPASRQDSLPLAYTPPHLSDEILPSRTTLEGERKQVAVFFADIKDSTRLIDGLDSEAARS